MKRRTDKCEDVIFSSGGFYVKQMGDAEKSLALLQMAVRLKRMKLQIKGSVIHIISVTCDFDTVTMIEKSKDILILKKEDAGVKTTRKRFHKKKVIRLGRLTCACSAGGLFSIIDKEPEQFHLLKYEEAVEVVEKAWHQKGSGSG